MRTNKFKIDDLFTVTSGDYHDTITLDNGDVPLISCGDEQQGLVGYFDIPKENVYRDCLTVAYNGLPLTTKYHPYHFAAKDDVAVLRPRKAMSRNTLLYIAAMLNESKWRYHYGRKCFRGKLQNVTLRLPAKNNEIDSDFIDSHFPVDVRSTLPAFHENGLKPSRIEKWNDTPITKLFDLIRGDFHSIGDLDAGKYRTVSRVTTLNGTVGYFDLPEDANIFPAGTITVSTVGGDAFVQLDEYIATDNVVILKPKTALKITTLFFIAFILNFQKWRYSYGRQCYRGKLAALKCLYHIRIIILTKMQ